MWYNWCMKKIIKYVVLVIVLISGVVLSSYGIIKIVGVINKRNKLDSSLYEVKSTNLNSEYDDKMIFISGSLILKNTLKDDMFDVSVTDSKLERVVEMYQYSERVDDENAESYIYETDWYPYLIDSSKFASDGFDNPKSMKFDGMKYYNDTYLGVYKLSNGDIDSLDTKSRYLDLDEKIASKYGLKIDGEYYTSSDDVDTPKVGDIRISFRYNSGSFVSIIGSKKGNTLENTRIYNERLSKDEMIKKMYPFSKWYVFSLISGITLIIIFVIVRGVKHE